MTHWAQPIINHNLAERDGSSVTRGDMKVDTVVFHRREDMSQKMRALPGRGWCALPDRIVDVQSANEWPEDPVLLAEKVDGNTSYHLRWNGQAWQLSIISRQETGSDWIFTHQLARIGGGHLTYEVAWKPDTQGVFRPSIFRLASIQTEEE